MRQALPPPAPRAPGSPTSQPDDLSAELAVEQAHVDRVYAELAAASRRVVEVEAEGLARGLADRLVDAQDEQAAALFQRDALVHHAAQRRAALETEHEGLVFGRLDLGPGTHVDAVRYVGRLGVRDDDYEPLVIDWRAPAAAPFYRATPKDPHGVIRRRVLRSHAETVVGIEDDLMVPEPPPGMRVIGDGALLAALTRARGPRMRDIVATIQAHQDEAIRASARGVTEIVGGPGTGKTVVALHRAAYLLYADRRRFESGGVLVVGPSAAYTAYIERVLPSLGEDAVTLRSLGDVVDAVDATRLDNPTVAAIKGSLRMRRVLTRAARDLVPDAPLEFRAFVAGQAIRVDQVTLNRLRAAATRSTPRNLATASLRAGLAEAAWRVVTRTVHGLDKADFLDRWSDDLAVDAFMAQWWPQVDPREALLWLADPQRLTRYAAGVLTPEEVEALAEAMAYTLREGTWTVADVALIDELTVAMGPVRQDKGEDAGFYEIDEYEDLAAWGVSEVGARAAQAGMREPVSEIRSHDPRERLLAGVLRRREEYAHILVDEAQDLSPMQWRMIGRRGRSASWTVVGDAAQAAWLDAQEAAQARDEAFGAQPRRTFRMDTNYRNAREIFDYARAVIRAAVPDADIPEAVRVTGVAPVEAPLTGPGYASEGAGVYASVAAHVDRLRGEVEGSIAVIAPAVHRAVLDGLDEGDTGRVVVLDPMSAKGLEWDATVVVDPDAIVAESPGGVRTLYVALTRAAHRMAVLR